MSPALISGFKIFLRRLLCPPDAHKTSAGAANEENKNSGGELKEHDSKAVGPSHEWKLRY